MAFQRYREVVKERDALGELEVVVQVAFQWLRGRWRGVGKAGC